MIGVFDSGVGGLTALGSLRALMPSADICFYADRKNSPYGTKSEEELLKITKNAISRLRDEGADFILMACCTASTVYPLLSKDEREICLPIIKPTAERAVSLTENGKIGVIATERTVSSHAFKNEINSLLPTASVTEIATQSLVTLAEEGECGAYASEKAISKIEELISPFIKDEPDTLILGCTHFPIFKKIISDLLPNTAIVSCSDEGARALAQRCTEEGEGRLNFIF